MRNVRSATEIRLLLADDDENQRAGLAKMIQSWGIAVETAADGQQALDKLSGFSRAGSALVVSEWNQ
jgi:CheY-like chemotaxis protein